MKNKIRCQHILAKYCFLELRGLKRINKYGLVLKKEDHVNNSNNGRVHFGNNCLLLGSNSTWLDSTRLDDSTRSTLSSQSSKSRRARRARRAVLFQHGGRRTILYKFSRFYALVYTNPTCFIK